MWTVYDTLLAGIPEKIQVRRVWAGALWSAVESDVGTGIARNVYGATRPAAGSELVAGISLRAAAARIKSWNYQEASLGLAAINAWYNTPLATAEEDVCSEEEGASVLRGMVMGRRVAWVGHSPTLERQLCPLCQSCVLERSPLMGDYPDTACDFLLPEQEVVFIPDTALITKTLPRLLSLSQRARVVLCGPGAPLASCLFPLGISHVESFLVDNQDACVTAICEGRRCQLSPYGRTVHLKQSGSAACIA